MERYIIIKQQTETSILHLPPDDLVLCWGEYDEDPEEMYGDVRFFKTEDGASRFRDSRQISGSIVPVPMNPFGAN